MTQQPAISKINIPSHHRSLTVTPYHEQEIKDCNAREIIYLLEHYILRVINNGTLNKYKTQIISYFKQQNMSGAQILQIERKAFVDSLATFCGDKKVRGAGIKLHNALHGNKGKLEISSVPIPAILKHEVPVFSPALRPKDALESVVINYESAYVANTHPTQDVHDTSSRVFSKQKQVILEKYMTSKITEIDSPIYAVEYAFRALNNANLKEHQDQIMAYLNQNGFKNKTSRDFVDEIMNDGEITIDHDESVLSQLYAIIAQYPEYNKLKSKVQSSQGKCCCLTCCCLCTCNPKALCCTCKSNYRTLESLTITNRVITPDAIVLDIDTPANDDPNLTQNAVKEHIELTTQPRLDVVTEHTTTDIEPNKAETLVISRSEDNPLISYHPGKVTPAHKLLPDDILCGLGDDWLDGLPVVDVIKYIEYAPLPFTLTFRRHKCCTTHPFLPSKKQNNALIPWGIKLMKLSMKFVSRGSSMLDVATDVRLLYKSSQNGVIDLTMFLFLTLVAPYILSYSSGVQIFLYRKTFETVKPFTFKSLLLILYLFPTGIIYFMLLDLVDALSQFYQWFAFGICNKLKSNNDLVRIESNIAQYFGMSRMDWESFKKQKLIAQLFFETLPQAILQVLLVRGVIDGKDEAGITDNDLILSLSAAFVNTSFQVFRLYRESQASKETFVQHSLHCVTARFEWVPYNDLIQEHTHDPKPLDLNYKIQYDLPGATCLSKKLTQRRATQPLRISPEHPSPIPVDTGVYAVYGLGEEQRYKELILKECEKKPKAAYGSVEFDFSSITLNKLITTIKKLPKPTLHSFTPIRIRFGDALRLVNVGDIVSLMRACAEKKIILPDIDEIDWSQPFETTTNSDDIRLYSNTFDADRKSLLISLYLTGYANERNYRLLKTFVSEYDVPINIPDDKGDTILHHMIRKRDFDGIHELLELLDPLQIYMLNFEARNAAGNTIMHELVEQENYQEIYDELKYLLNKIRATSGASCDLNVFNSLGESVLYLALEHDRKLLKKMRSFIKTEMASIIHKQKTQHAQEDDEKKELHIEPTPEYIFRLITKKEKDQIYVELETMMHVLHFRMHQIEMHQIETKRDSQYDEIKQLISESGYEDRKGNRQLDHQTMDCIIDNVRKSMSHPMIHSLCVEHDPKVVLCPIHRDKGQTALGHILTKGFLEDIGIYTSVLIEDLLEAESALFANESSVLYDLFVHIIETKLDRLDEAMFYLRGLNYVISHCNVSADDICDTNSNNPLHAILRQEGANLSVIAYLCTTYHEWMSMESNVNNIPLYVAIKHKNFDVFYCLCSEMIEHKLDVKGYLSKRSFVLSMIEFGTDLIINKNVIMLQILLSTFEYSQIFRFAMHNTFDTNADAIDVSLIKSVSVEWYADKMKDMLLECGVDEQYMKDEWAEKVKPAEASTPTPPPAPAIMDESDQKVPPSGDDSDEEEEQKVANEGGTEVFGEVEKKEKEFVFGWIELIYTTIVEAASAADLWTDIVIIMQLIQSDNQWWSTFMLSLLIAPYLVSHGSLVVILQKKVQFNKDTWWCCSKLRVLSMTLLLTPIALVYLFFIDVVFIVFAIISTVWLVLLILMTWLCCRSVHDSKGLVANYDIHNWIDQQIFEKLLNMNRTEIVGYRRLRTLSQLFFETIPQIVLQVRILWVLNQWSEKEDVDSDLFKIVDLKSLAWSIGLAAFHLLLEGGIIYLDKRAFKMGFMQYSLECLGGRVQWVPFQHLLHDIIPNQLYIEQKNDRENFNTEDAFDVRGYEVDLSHTPKDTEVLAFDYEDIRAPLECACHCVYRASYQFSPQTLSILTQKLMNCPPIIIPKEFNLSRNSVLRTLFRQIMCKAQIKLGRDSFGNVDILSFCDLYRASCNKVNINLASVHEMPPNKDEDNTEEGKARQKQLIEDKIKDSLLYFGEIEAMNWRWIDKDHIDIEELKEKILSNSTDSARNGIIRLDILRKCYLNQFYVASNCKNVQRIKTIIAQYRDKADEDASWYFVIILLLLYSKGTVFGEHCTDCAMDPSLKDKLKDYIPTCIQISVINVQNIPLYDVKIPFKLFEGCLEFRALYRENVEEILINKCKDFMISWNKTENKRFEQKRTTFDLKTQFKKWDILEQVQNKEKIRTGVEKLLYQLYKMDIQSWNIIFLDKLVFESKMYLHYNQYLYNTLPHRTLEEHQYSAMKAPDGEEKVQMQSVSIDQLIPHFDRKQRYQIYELKIGFEIEHVPRIPFSDEDAPVQVSFVPNIPFIDEALNTNSNNDIFLWKGNWDDAQHDDVKMDYYMCINEANIGLSYYNYQLLHCDPDQNNITPNIEISNSLNNVYTLKITTKYTTLFKTTAAVSGHNMGRDEKKTNTLENETNILKSTYQVLSGGEEALSADAFKEWVKENDPRVNDKQLEEIINNVDVDHDGFIDFNEFETALKSVDQLNV
eukprot:825442_1